MLLPNTVRLSYSRWPEEDEGEIVQFRLIYRGSLPAQRGGGKGGSRGKEKHNIRKQLHPQLKELWQQRWHLQRQLTHEYTPWYDPPDSPIKMSMSSVGTPEAQKIANKFKEGKFRFLPLITGENGLACKLDILFLRRDAPGNLIESGGDIDNRIKVLFDALKVPDRGSMEELTPETNEDPLFCLLEDDKLITEVSITTDRLLYPIDSNEHIHDVLLIISVTTKMIEATLDNFEFLGD